MKCQCPPSDESFSCSISGCTMTPHQRTLCKTRLNYRAFYQDQRCDHIADGGEMVNEFVDGNKLVNAPDSSTVTRTKRNGAQKVPKQLRSLEPGTALELLLAELGVASTESCGCKSFRNKMNAWGVEGCREHRAEIIEHLNQMAKKATWREKIAVAIGAVTTAATWLNPLDAAGSLLDEALRRAEKSLM